MEQKKLNSLRCTGALFKIMSRSAAAIVLLTVCLAIHTEAADFNLEPSILIGQEYNDNLFLTQYNRIDTPVTHLEPAVRFKYATAFWEWNLDYTFDYYYYWRHNIQNDYSNTLHFKNKTEFIKNLLFLEVLDDYSRVSQNSAINYAEQSSFVNQVDQNIFTVNPYLVLKPAETVKITPGYMFQDTHYKDGGGINRIDNIGYLETIFTLSSRLTLTTGVKYTKDQNSIEGYKEFDIYAGPIYTFAEKSTIYFLFGESNFNFDQTKSANGWYWYGNAGIKYLLSTFTFGFDARRQFVEDPAYVLVRQDSITASISKTMERLLLTVSANYSDYLDVPTNQLYQRSKDVGVTARYRFSPRDTGIAYGDFQVVDYLGAVFNGVTNNGVVRIITSSLRFEHLLTAKDTLSFEYRYTDSYSSGVPTSNYMNNRYIVEYKKIF